MFFFGTNVLHFSEEFYGTVLLIDGIAQVIGALHIYILDIVSWVHMLQPCPGQPLVVCSQHARLCWGVPFCMTGNVRILSYATACAVLRQIRQRKIQVYIRSHCVCRCGRLQHISALNSAEEGIFVDSAHIDCCPSHAACTCHRWVIPNIYSHLG